VYHGHTVKRVIRTVAWVATESGHLETFPASFNTRYRYSSPTLSHRMLTHLRCFQGKLHWRTRGFTINLDLRSYGAVSVGGPVRRGFRSQIRVYKQYIMLYHDLNTVTWSIFEKVTNSDMKVYQFVRDPWHDFFKAISTPSLIAQNNRCVELNRSNRLCCVLTKVSGRTVGVSHAPDRKVELENFK